MLQTREIIKQNRGFTLIETLVAISVLLLALAGPLTLARQSLTAINVSKDQITAYYLAQDVLEYIKNVRDTNMVLGAGWLTGLTSCFSGCIIDTSQSFGNISQAVRTDDGSCTPLQYDSTTNRYGCTASWEDSIFSREIEITETVANQEAFVEVTITWERDGHTYDFTASTYLFNLSQAVEGGVVSGGMPGGDDDDDDPPPPTTGLIAHWPFDSNANDTSGNGHHGTFVNGASITVASKVGPGALNLDGINDYVRVDSPGLPTGDFTYAAWLFLDSRNDETFLMAPDPTGLNEISFQVGDDCSDGRICIEINEGGDISSTVSITGGTWHHVAIVRSGSSVQIYINGVQRGGGSAGATLNFGSCAFYIGVDLDNTASCGGNHGNYFNGIIDDVYIYDEALSQSEIATLMNSDGDTTPPSKVTNLAVSDPQPDSLDLSWTAPGDDGSSGTAAAYDVRYSTSNITSSNFDSATQVSGEPSPLAAGQPQSMTVSGLAPSTLYYFALKARDEVGNVSSLSNVAFGTTASAGDTTPPVISNGSPSGTLPAGTTQANMSVNTNENATCRWSTTNQSYLSMPNTFTTTGGTNHSYMLLGLTDGTNYTRYIRCQDSAGNPNTSSYVVSFSVGSSPQPGGLVGHWTFDNTGSDASGNGHTASLSGATYSSSAVVGSGALSLDGNDYASVTSFDPPTSDYTYAVWVRPSSLADERIFMASNGTSAENEFALSILSGNILNEMDNSVRLTSSETIPVSQWTHLALTRSGSSVVLYINGQSAETASYGSTLSFSGCRRLLIGVDADDSCAGNLGNYFNGLIDDARVYNEALSPAEIQALCDMGSGGCPGSGSGGGGEPSGDLVAHWTFDNTWSDASGNGYTLTPRNGATFGSGIVGSAGLQVTGSTDYAERSNFTELDNDNTLSIAAWIRFNSLSGSCFLVSKNLLFEFGTHSSDSNNLFVGFNNEPYSNVPKSNTNLSTGTWYHIGVTYDGSTKRYYLNGKADGTASANMTINSNSNPILIGARSSTQGQCNALVDDVRIYDTVLSESDMQLLCEMGSGGCP